MNAFECLEAYRKAAGFDKWIHKNIIYTMVEALPPDARPAWRDGDGWFVLPDGWTWDSIAGCFLDGDVYVERLYAPLDNAWRYGDCKEIATAATAPEAFRAAERYLIGGE